MCDKIGVGTRLGSWHRRQRLTLARSLVSQIDCGAREDESVGQHADSVRPARGPAVGDGVRQAGRALVPEVYIHFLSSSAAPFARSARGRVRPPLVFPARLLKLAPFDATSLLFFFSPLHHSFHVFCGPPTLRLHFAFGSLTCPFLPM